MKFLQHFLYRKFSGDEHFQLCFVIVSLVRLQYLFHFGRVDFLDTIFFLDSFIFFLYLNTSSLSPGLQSVYWEVSLECYDGVLHVVAHFFFLVALKIACVFDHRLFTHNVISCNHCRLKLFGILWASWIWIYFSFHVW